MLLDEQQAYPITYGQYRNHKNAGLQPEKSMSEKRAREGVPKVERKSGVTAESKTIEHSKKKVSVEFIKASIL